MEGNDYKYESNSYRGENEAMFHWNIIQGLEDNYLPIPLIFILVFINKTFL